jgi:hypothetical protein
MPASDAETGKKILLIDDDPLHRLLAQRDLKSVAYHNELVVPQMARELDTLDLAGVSLVISDRHLGTAWESATRRLMQRLPSSVPIWEWTCDEWGEQILPRVDRVIVKRTEALVAAVKEWLSSFSKG